MLVALSHRSLFHRINQIQVYFSDIGLPIVTGKDGFRKKYPKTITVETSSIGDNVEYQINPIENTKRPKRDPTTPLEAKKMVRDVEDKERAVVVPKAKTELPLEGRYNLSDVSDDKHLADGFRIRFWRNIGIREEVDFKELTATSRDEGKFDYMEAPKESRGEIHRQVPSPIGGQYVVN